MSVTVLAQSVQFFSRCKVQTLKILSGQSPVYLSQLAVSTFKQIHVEQNNRGQCH